MRRNPGFSLRTPEAVSSASGRVSEKDIRGWFQMIENWLIKEELREVLDDPTRVFNGDETSFYLHPKSKEVIARTGSRNVYEVEQASGKQNVTVMFTFGASGVIVNPHVILPGKRIRKEVAQGFPSEWGLGQSDRGWMDTHNFREYIQKIFHPFLLKQGVQLPVILFVDGHASHKALEVADLCSTLGIVLISLYPNTTHITQPADVAVFKPLKSEWRRSVEEWRYEHQGCALTITYFGSVLSKTVERGITSKTVQSGFRVCGLHPFDPNAVDYSKCISKVKPTNTETTVVSNTPEEQTFPAVQLSSYSDHHQDDQICEQNNSGERDVKISIDRIIEAYDLIGADTIARIDGDVYRLTREERIIRFFYREFIRPHINFHDLSATENVTYNFPQAVDATRNEERHDFTSSSLMDIDINSCEIVHVEDISTCGDKLPLIVELSTSDSNGDSMDLSNSNTRKYYGY